MREVHQPVDLGSSHDLIGDQNLLDPCLQKNLGLAELGAGNPIAPASICLWAIRGSLCVFT